MKKIISLVCCLSLILAAFTCCKKQDTQEPMQTVSDTAETEQTPTEQPTSKTDNRQISLSYNSKQSFNPFTTESTTNKNIAALLYDSLFRLDREYNAVPLLAKTYSLDGRTLTVILKDGLYFSDGTALTLNDIIVSFNTAKKSPVYSSRLANFSSASAGSDSKSMTFTLKKSNIYAVNCLDFPVAKSGTVSENIPVGSGRYILKKSKGAYTLEANEQNTRNEELEQSKIYLYPADAESGELYQLQIGDISFIFDNMSQNTQRKQITASTIDVPLNILVFLGFNNSGELFKDMNVKNAGEAAIDI
ncbi:MAG: ABC transporter substrate-binding protein, partial [Acutalibacteraceae bacterium]